MYKVIVFLYLGFSLFVFAQATDTIVAESNIQNLVKQVKKAAPSQKRLLINKLKLMLRQSNQMHRTQVMKELKQSFRHIPSKHKATQKEKHKFGQVSNNGKHQPKRRQNQYGKGNGERQGTGGKGGGMNHK